MKKTLLYIASLLIASAGFVSCDDDFERFPMQLPEATWQANTTIAELKLNNWSDERNYANEIGLTESGEHIIIKGRVTTSDQSGNIYKNFVIDDGTGALTVSVNMKNIYQSYLRGQEVVIDATGLFIGKYNGMLQLGSKLWYEDKSVWETSHMEEDVLKAHAQQNGLSNVSEIDTIVVTIPELNEYKNNKEKFVGMVSRLVKLENVRWEDGGKEFAGTANANRYVIDEAGNKILFRNSAYSDFSYDLLPYANGDVIGILGVYGTDWQLSLIDAAGLQNFDPNAGPEDVPGYGRFQKVTTVTSGKKYLLVANGNKMAQPIASNKNYGYFNVTDVTAQEDGTVKITNASLGKWIQYSSNYTSYGAYNSDQDGGYRPVLYEKIEK